MKILVASDLHGSGYYARKLNEIIEKENPDRIILLGDLYYHGPRNQLSLEYAPMEASKILNSYKDKIVSVRGNCDAEVDEMISEFEFKENLNLEICGKRFFFTHGHRYNMDKFPEEEFDIMVYGHFHTGFIKEEYGKIFVNSGSISLPKNGTKNSYLIIEEQEILLKDIDGNVIEKTTIGEN